MARPHDISRWRRYAMQAIMWVILAGTIGLAALVNVEVGRKHGGALGEPVTVRNLSIRLPLGWRATDEGDDFIEVQEPGDGGRMIEVRVGGAAPSLFDAIRLLGQARSSALRDEKIDIGGRAGRLVVRRQPIETDEGIWMMLLVTATAGDTTITLRDFYSRGREVEANVDLIKRIAATAEFVIN